MADNPIVDWLLRIIKTYAIKGLKRVTEQSQEKLAAGVIVLGFAVTKAMLATETQRLVNSNDAQKAVTGLFLEFLFGVGPRTREFGPGTIMAERMKDAPGVEDAKEYFYESRAETYKLNAKIPGTLARNPLTNYSAGFNPILGPLLAGIDAVEQFIGNYKVEIFPNGQATQMEIVCTNVTSVHSFLYHLPFVKNYERGTGALPTPMGNIQQIISWTERIDASQFRVKEWWEF